MMPAYAKSKWYSIFFISYLCIVLYILMNLVSNISYDINNVEITTLFLYFQCNLQSAKSDVQSVNLMSDEINSKSGHNFPRSQLMMKL
jgi:hypothetical protein